MDANIYIYNYIHFQDQCSARLPHKHVAHSKQLEFFDGWVQFNQTCMNKYIINHADVSCGARSKFWSVSIYIHMVLHVCKK